MANRFSGTINEDIRDSVRTGAVRAARAAPIVRYVNMYPGR